MQLLNKYRERGLEILAFPCNQFHNQEPGTHDEIIAFAKKFNAHDKFVFFEKGNVNGKHARDVYKFLKHKLPNGDGSTDIKWNFSKFLIDHRGNPRYRFGPKVYPLEMENVIEALLDRKVHGEK